MHKGSSSARENTLARIKDALQTATPAPFPNPASGPFFNDFPENDLVARFCKEFTGLLGKAFICADQQDALVQLERLARQNQWSSVHFSRPEGEERLRLEELSFVNDLDIHSAQAAITDCECLVARTGGIVISSAQASGRVIPVYSPVHIVMAYPGQVVADVDDAINLLEKKYSGNLPSSITFASGPSRTGDIEKTLVVGVHGPREVYVFFIGA